MDITKRLCFKSKQWRRTVSALTLVSCLVSILVSWGAETISLFVLCKPRLQSSAFSVGGIQWMIVETVKGSWKLMGFRQVAPECATLACGLFRAEDNQGSTDSRGAFYLSPTCSQRTELPEKTFYIKKADLYGMTNICLLNICSSHLPVKCFPPPLKSQIPTPLLNPEWYMSLHCLTRCEPFISLWDFWTYRINFFPL